MGANIFSFKNGEVKVGSSVELKCFISKVLSTTDDKLIVRIADNSGEIDGELVSVEAEDVIALKGQPVTVNASYWKSADGGGYITVTDVKEIPAGSVDIMQFYDGISERKRGEYIKEMEKLIKSVSHPGYKALLVNAFTKEKLRKYTTLPATMTRHGYYVGGLIASVINTTSMALAMADVYETKGNRLYTGRKKINRDLLIAAGLLMGYGGLIYRGEKIMVNEHPVWRKTTLGIQLGNGGCLRKLLDEVVREKNIELSDLELAALYNAQSQVLNEANSNKPVTREGKLLTAAYRSYTALDEYDREQETHKADDPDNEYYEEWFFSEKLNGYMVRDYYEKGVKKR